MSENVNAVVKKHLTSNEGNVIMATFWELRVILGQTYLRLCVGVKY